MPERYRDRIHAGRMLAASLKEYAHRPDVLVLALPSGGVPVANEVARLLDAPLDVFLVRKLGVPGQEELAMGAIATGGVRVINPDVVNALNIPTEVLDRATDIELKELERREHEYRGDRPAPQVQDHVVIVVDDGLATGSTMRAAVAALRQQNPQRLIVAVPVAPFDTCAAIRPLVDELVCPMTPEVFYAVGAHYETFGQTSDEEVRELLRRREHAASH